MRKTFFALFALALLMPVLALGEITMTVLADSETGSKWVEFEAKADMPAGAPGKEMPIDPTVMGINMQIAVRFEQEAAKAALSRAGAQIIQQGMLWQDGKTASMARTWQGEQADGREGSSAAALTVSLETGMEIYLDELFDDPQAAFAAMEAIIADDVLENMSDYMEYAELLPMPTDSYAVDERGLTVYWDEDRYRYFDGTSGYVMFYWHEIAEFIGEESPVYALAHPQVNPNPETIRQSAKRGELGDVLDFGLGIGSHATLHDVKVTHPLADPDYTRDALVYPLERMRGYAVEIPKYAETAEDDTEISAIRASRISVDHMLTTGKTTDAEILSLLGDPDKEIAFDEDAAMDALLEPGRSLYYSMKGHVLQLHLDETDTLSMVILRREMPES